MVEIGVLGPLVISHDGLEIELGPSMQRRLLAILELAGDTIVGTDDLIERLWRGRPPASAPHAVQVYVSSVRKVLAETGAAIEHDRDRPGYRLTGFTSDRHRFEELASAGKPAEALSLWRGDPYRELDDDDRARAEVARLEQLRLAALEARIVAELDGGRSAQLVAELTELCDVHPFHERFWELLATALYRSGRQADALRKLADVGRLLRDELGIEPGIGIRNLEQRILDQDPGLDRPPARETAPPPSETAPTPADRTGRRPLHPPLADEMRVVTALFTDVVGSTPLGEQLEPGDFKLVIDGAIARIVESIEQFGGTVLGVAGDGVCAIFGVPHVNEDDADRAVRSGLEIQERLGGYRDEIAAGWGIDPPSARVGIHTGPVAIGQIGGGAIDDLTALGDTMNLGSRIESNAPIGRVLVSDETRNRCSSAVEWDERETIRVKGRRQPVGVSTVKAVAARSPRTVARRSSGLLVGRDTELRLCCDAVDGLAAGRGGVVALTGPAGHGKSRLLAEVRDRATDDGIVRWIDIVAASHLEHTPYAAAGAGLRAHFGAEGMAPLRALITIQRALEPLVDDIADGLPNALRALMELGGEPDDDAAAIPDAFLDLVVAMVEHRPTVLAIDDLHWADPSMLDLCHRLMELTDEMPLLLVLAARPEPDHGSWSVIERARREYRHRLDDVRIEPLSGSDALELLDGLTEGIVLPTLAQQQLLELSAGVPFYLEELTRTVAESLSSRLGDPTDPTTADVVLPGNIDQVVSTRFSRLDSTTRWVGAVAAILGIVIDESLVAEVADIGQQELDAALAVLHRKGFIVDTARSATARFEFAHALSRASVAESLTPSRRLEVHQRALDHLETTRDPVDAAAELGVHAIGAGELERAFDYLMLAGSGAAAIGSMAEADRHFAMAAELAEQPKTSFTDGQLASALLAHGRARIVLAQDARAALRRAAQLAKAAEETIVEQEALEHLAIAEMTSDYAASAATLERVAELAHKNGDVRGDVYASARRAILSANQGNLVEATEAAARAVDLADDDELKLVALDGRKLVHAYLGRFDDQVGDIQEIAACCERVDDSFYGPYATAERALGELARGELDVARATLDEAATDAKGRDHELVGHVALSWRGWVETAAGRFDEAERCHDEDGVPDLRMLAVWHADLQALFELESGRAEKAIATNERCHAEAVVVGARLQAVRASSRLASHRLQPNTERSDWLDRTLAQLEMIRTPPRTILLPAWDAYTNAACELVRIGELDRARTLASAVVDAATPAPWHEAVAVGLLLLAETESGQTQADLIARAIDAASLSQAPATQWRCQVAKAATTSSTAAALQPLSSAQRLITEMAGSIADPENRQTFEAAAAADLDDLVERFS